MHRDSLFVLVPGLLASPQPSWPSRRYRARYGSFGAACHYADGTFALAAAESECARTGPETGAAFGFWHPPLVTLHVWLWYHNPSGIYSGTNPLVAPFNES